MPMRAYRASREAISTSAGHAGAHVASNKLVWMVVCAIVGAGAFYLNWAASGRAPSRWGDVGALAVMILGILIMMKAQEGHVRPEADPDEDENTDPI